MTRSPARESAFGATPQRVPPGTGDARERWLVAVVLGGQGHYAAAAASLERLAADPTTPPDVAAHAAVTRAAHLRQLGGHAVARTFDARGLRLATAALRAGGPDRSVIAGSGRPPSDSATVRAETVADPSLGQGIDDGLDAAAARLDALIGLAADAVGLGDPSGAQRLLDLVGSPASAHPSWRPGVRADWVLAELQLLRGRPDQAVRPAAAALAASRRAASRRHVLKSRIVLAVAEGAAGESSESSRAAVTELDDIVACTGRLGLLPLRWPAALAAADLWNLFNEREAAMATSSPGGGPDGATRRRHAAGVALSVLEQRSDPLGKRQMGESVWIPRPTTLL